MNKILMLVMCAVIVSCLPKETQSESNGSTVVKWDLSKRSFPLQLSIGSDFSSLEVLRTQEAAEAWDNEVGRGIRFLNTDSSTQPKSNNLNSFNDNVMGVYKISPWPASLDPKALAVTQIFGTRKNVGQSNEYIEITHADILVNQNYHFSTGTGFGFDLTTVLGHEMGHFLGLEHSNTKDINKSIMAKSISESDIQRSPLSQDVSALTGLYNLTGSASVASRSIASSSSGNSKTEAVRIIYELRVDGTERKTIESLKTNKKHVIYHHGCEH